MKQIRPKTARIKLESDAYVQLRGQVLDRDHWRCQVCGSRQQLQVHHKELRSQCGSDSPENLITLCEQCHLRAHRLKLSRQAERRSP